MRCVTCRAVYPDGISFCPDCGTRLTEDAVERRARPRPFVVTALSLLAIAVFVAAIVTATGDGGGGPGGSESLADATSVGGNAAEFCRVWHQRLPDEPASLSEAVDQLPTVRRFNDTLNATAPSEIRGDVRAFTHRSKHGLFSNDDWDPEKMFDAAKNIQLWVDANCG